MSTLNVGLNDEDESQVKLDLGIDRNHAVLILGSSGSGKTQLLKKMLKEIDSESALFVFGDTMRELTASNTVHVDIDESAPEFGDRTVFTVKGSKSEQTTFETLSKVFTRIISMPLAREKFVIFDNVFLHFEDNETFAQLVRMGRKLNIKVIFATQNLERVDDAGINLFKNFGNRVIMFTASEHQPNVLKAGIASEEDFADVSGNKRFVVITSDSKTKVKVF